MAAPTDEGNDQFDFAAALAKVDPTIVTVFGPKLRDVAPAEFQEIASAVLTEDYLTVCRLSHSWGGLFEALGATPLVRHSRQLEKLANLGDAVGIAGALGLMRADLTRFCRTLTHILESSPSDQPSSHGRVVPA